ncbi:MAG: fatty acid cis/trans isomerase, partial [Deltaproteobacteria bacterium]|nr:fatty acid cis/trans isomerase [Deltaproteobacteria bacterium]
LRVEGETYFLDFLPLEQRKELMQSWYDGVKFEDIHTFTGKIATQIDFATNNQQREFIETLVNNHISPETGITFDPINYFSTGEEPPQKPEQYDTPADFLRGLRSIAKPESPLFRHFSDYNANLAYLHIHTNDGRDIAISMIINRWHDNVSFLFGEDKVLDPTKDHIDFIPGFVGSYPNYFLDVNEADFPDFIDLLSSFHDTKEEIARFNKYVVNRADDDFWEHYDWFQKRFDIEQPVNSGLFDLNRYNFIAAPKQPLDIEE